MLEIYNIGVKVEYYKYNNIHVKIDYKKIYNIAAMGLHFLQ